MIKISRTAIATRQCPQFIQLLSVLLICCLIFNACKKEKKQSGEPTQGVIPNPVTGLIPSVVNSNVIIVSRDTLRGSLNGIDSTQISFKANGFGTERIKPGVILSSGILPLAPYGFLRKVISTERVAGNLVCMTEQAVVTDAIQSGSLRVTKEFTTGDIQTEALRGPRTNALKVLATKSISKEFTITLNHDLDLEGDGRGGKVSLEGSLTNAVKLDLSIDYDGLVLKNALAQVTITKEMALKIAYEFTGKSSVKELQLGSIYLGSIEADMGIPVVFDVRLAFALGVDGELTTKVTTGITTKQTNVWGISYDNKAWRSFHRQDTTFKPIPFQIESSGRVFPYVAAKLVLLPYGLSNFGIGEVDIYLADKNGVEAEVVANSNNGYSASLKYLVELSAVFRTKFLGRILDNYDNKFFSVEWPIWQKNFSFPVLSTTDVSAIGTTSATGGGNITSSGGLSITARGVCWSTTSNPTIAYSKTSNGTGTGTFTSSLAGLLAGKTYYYRAYATNSAGTAYGITKNFTTTAVATGSALLATPSSLDFGNVKSGSGSSLTLVLKNTGTQGINVGNLQVSSPYFINWNGGFINAGTSQSVTVTFNPSANISYPQTLIINSSATNANLMVGLSGLGSSTGGSTPTTGSPIAVPAVNTYPNCVAIANTVCPGGNTTYSDGTIAARILSIDKNAHTLIFEVKKCNGANFNAGGNVNIVSDLCNGSSYTFQSFNGGTQTFQVKITNADMSGTKAYRLFIIQQVSGGSLQYDAPLITVTY